MGMNENKIEMQELHCHNCNGYVQFPIDMSLNGNHELKCPACGHSHYRVVENGIITGERYDSANRTFQVNQTSITYTLTASTSYATMNWGGGSYGTGDLWGNGYTVTDYMATT